MLVAAAIALGGWLSFSPSHAPVLQADEVDPLVDSDGDFLPDVVEWAVMTNAANADTDGDECPDFVEVVQRGTPRQRGVVRTLDHEMRVVVTAPQPGVVGPTWLHLLFRFVGDTSLMNSFNCFITLPGMPGVRLPLNMLAFSTLSFAERQTAANGLWVRLSVPMVSESMLRMILPCTIEAEATIGGRSIATAVNLFDAQGVTSSLVPFTTDRLAMQSIGQLCGPTSSGSNRVCLLGLQRVGAGIGGTVFEVVDAACEDCNELECSPGCPQSVGWIFTLPGGIESITGG